jgi:hypothetical protein
VCILIMCMYVYWSYNELKNYYLNSEIYYSKLIFQLWNVYIFELKLWYLNLRNIYVNLNFLFAFWFFCSNKNHYLSLKIVIPILQHFILILKSIFEPENCYSNFETFYLNLEFNIWIWSFKYEFLKLLVLFKKYVWV